MSNKTEKPTQKRLRDARKRGQILISREVSSAAGYFVLIVSMVSMLPWLWNRVQRLFALVWSDKVMHSTADSWQEVLTAIMRDLAELALPVALIAASATAFAAFAQARGIFSADPVLPKMQRINPVEGFKRIFSSHNLFNLIKLLVKLILMSATVTWIITQETDPILRLMYGVPIESGRAAARLLLVLFSAAGGLFAVFATIDFFHQRFEYLKKMRMSKEEVRREHRDMDGNPQVKSALRRLARELAFSTPGEGTRKASVLVVNPTHFAVAIFYEPGITDLPIVLEKASDDQALFLREIAREVNVPIFEYPSLARELYATAAVSAYIPQEHFAAVAEVLNWVRNIRPAGADMRAVPRR